MLSRVAESMFWMSRYIERAENVARFIDVNLEMILDVQLGFSEQWEPLVTTSGDHENFHKRFGAPTKENVLKFLIFDRENSNSILSCLVAARENARSVRESITTAMWEQINTFYLMVKDAANAPEKIIENPHAFCTKVRLASHLFVGIMDGTLSRSEGWHFCRTGRLIERADKTSRLVDVKYFILLPSLDDIGTPVDDNQWAAVLRSASALEMYRQCHGRISPHQVVEFLILDRDFPRAVNHCLDRADISLHAITGSSQGSFNNLAEQRLGQLRSELAYLRSQDMFTIGLHEFFDSLQTKLNNVGSAIHETFFARRPFERNGRF